MSLWNTDPHLRPFLINVCIALLGFAGLGLIVDGVFDYKEVNRTEVIFGSCLFIAALFGVFLVWLDIRRSTKYTFSNEI
jgi:hypothetical protein